MKKSTENFSWSIILAPASDFFHQILRGVHMNTTTNYTLPQWEKSDPIKMSDFNDLTHKLDTALKSHDDTLNTKADTSSVTAVQQEVAAAREANCLVKLAGPLVTTTENGTLNFDLSQVDMTKIAALFFTFCAGQTNGTMTLAVNNTSLGTLCTHNWSTSAGFVWLVPFGSGVAFSTLLTSSGSSSGGAATNTDLKWVQLKKLTISGTSYAGATATLFAVRK